jgi:ElaB/YqjD/DUF883 family membrane-anchored ribosome-binding protein
MEPIAMTTQNEAAREKLIADFKAVVVDTEELLRATANQTGERVATARARAQESLTNAKDQFTALGNEVIEGGRAVANSADEYVRANPWQSISIAAAVGLLVGLLARRK